MKVINCLNCGSPELKRFIDLGLQPNGNHFPSQEEFPSEQRFPFAMAVCPTCWQVQLEEFPSMEFMFSNHPYVTGVNTPVVEHFQRMVARTLARFQIEPNSLVLDIGANDGTLLSKFRDAGMRTLGVDPGRRTGQLARHRGITVCETFWNHETGKALRSLNLRPDLITATAVFYHIPDIHNFVQGLREVMQPRTVFLTQCIYLKDVLEKFQFDHFYHEHTMIHALAPLQPLFARHGMRMLDVDFEPVHGGSFVLYVGLEESPFPTSKRIAEAIAREKDAGLQRLEIYLNFTRKVEKNRSDLVSLLQTLKDQKKKVFALGAPLKGSTLLNYCQIGPEFVQLATEVNKFKIGRYTPGTHIPIVYEDDVTQQPDYYMVLSWNFLDFFVRKYSSFLKAGGKFILPHPDVRVCGAELLENIQSVA